MVFGKKIKEYQEQQRKKDREENRHSPPILKAKSYNKACENGKIVSLCISFPKIFVSLWHNSDNDDSKHTIGCF